MVLRTCADHLLLKHIVTEPGSVQNANHYGLRNRGLTVVRCPFLRRNADPKKGVSVKWSSVDDIDDFHVRHRPSGPFVELQLACLWSATPTKDQPTHTGNCHAWKRRDLAYGTTPISLHPYLVSQSHRMELMPHTGEYSELEP